MAVPLALPEDVAALWRPITPAETSRVAYLINLASAKLRAALPNLDGRIALYATVPDDTTAIDPVLVAGVVAGIVKRALVNPEGVQSSTRTVGPYSESRTFGAAGSQASSDIQVTPEDLAQLLGASRSSKTRTLEVGLTAKMLPDRRNEIVGWTDQGYPLLRGQVP